MKWPILKFISLKKNAEAQWKYFLIGERMKKERLLKNKKDATTRQWFTGTDLHDYCARHMHRYYT